VRITATNAFLTMKQAIASAQSRYQGAQLQVSSGKTIRNYADSPVNASIVVKIASSQSSYSDYDKAATAATGWLSAQDAALQDASSLITQARSLALQAANTGSQTQESREALAAEVDQLRGQMMAVANTTRMGRSVFGGFGQTAVTADADGTYRFAGDQGKVNFQVSPTDTVTVNTDGAAAFGFTSGKDVFSVLSEVAGHIRSGDTTALSGDISTLDARAEDVYSGLEVVGATSNHVEALQSRGQSQVISLTQSRSALEDTDMAQGILNLQEAQNAYESALAVASMVAKSGGLASYLV
jgi:flagellar hook-associated protein 3 FlgL